MVLDTEYLIVGAGIAGLTLAIGFKQRNIPFVLIEKNKIIDGIGAGLGISSNAILAFQKLNIHKNIQRIANPLQHLNIVDENGKLLIKGDPYILPNYDLTNYALHRSDLHKTLLELVPKEHIQTQKELVSIKPLTEGYEVIYSDNTTFRCKYIIGADGIYSQIRHHIFPKSNIIYSGYTCWRATISLKYHTPHQSTETWGKAGRFGITPLTNDRIYWYACINTPTVRDTKYSQYNVEDLRNNFANYHQDIVTCLTHTTDDLLIHNDISYLEPLSQYHLGGIVLIGDAAHATTPNLGQGACMGIEDAVVLLQEIDKYSHKVHKAFEQYSKRRISRCQFIVNRSTQMGKIAQLDNPILIAIRNQLVSIIPPFIQRNQFKKLLDMTKVL
jgi:2-polyprenyl-6-methoxyphenol hydroxylase-like FAD-dependent oxidoreductase